MYFRKRQIIINGDFAVECTIQNTANLTFNKTSNKILYNMGFLPWTGRPEKQHRQKGLLWSLSLVATTQIHNLAESKLSYSRLIRDSRPRNKSVSACALLNGQQEGEPEFLHTPADSPQGRVYLTRSDSSN